jgi:hypothetical protein
MTASVVIRWHIVQGQQGLSPLLEADCRTFLDQVCCQTIDASFGELFAARLAGVLISVARIVQFRASLEVSENQS